MSASRKAPVAQTMTTTEVLDACITMLDAGSKNKVLADVGHDLLEARRLLMKSLRTLSTKSQGTIDRKSAGAVTAKKLTNEIIDANLAGSSKLAREMITDVTIVITSSDTKEKTVSVTCNENDTATLIAPNGATYRLAIDDGCLVLARTK